MIPADTCVSARRTARPWTRASRWLAFLAPFFFLSYGLATFVTAQRARVGSIVFGWEHTIPFLAWTIIPYWSIDLFYGLSLFLCATTAELDVHGRRLFTAQVVAVACFILWPLRFTWAQPATHGVSGFLFATLTRFDKPFNQAPSLHIALLVILWPLYTKYSPLWSRWILHAWFALVGISVLTTYQHHFIDVPTGALLGMTCLWIWPEGRASAVSTAVLSHDRRRLMLATCYLLGSSLLMLLAVLMGGTGLWMLWPAVSLALVAANYAVFGPDGFQKNGDGRMSLAARVLLAPYLAAAFVNSRVWTRHDPKPVPIADGVWLGRFPTIREAARFASVIDLSAELPGAATAAPWECIPMLDLVPPRPCQLREAAAIIERGRSRGPVLVCCALGYSRSAATVATWLLTNRAVNSVGDAVETIRRARPRIVIAATLRAAIECATERVA